MTSSTPPPISPAFPGTDRYQVIRCLGSGSFGVVYEALDRETRQRVALKVPHESRALPLLLFKQEFRALADVSHPNLVSLLELGTVGETWFFAMEKVEGQDLFTYLRDGAAQPGAHRSGHYLVGALASGMPTPPTAASSFASGDDGRGPGIPSPSFYSPPSDFERIRRSFRQLAEGLMALHGVGIIHRDLKPSNVLVTPLGRVVLLDFGLALAHAEADPIPTHGHGAVGTPAYAAPEQVETSGSSPASDWYAVGVMLYQVLTGCLPHTGNYLEMLRAKQELDPCPPSLLVRGIPEDLESLCLDLLARNPAERPGGLSVLGRLSGPGTPPVQPPPPQAQDLESHGARRQELGALMGSFLDARSGITTTALLHGASGMGKSALVRQFAREAKAASPRALILKARCFEQENVPFKALDGLMDGLSHFLRRLQPTELQAILPPHTPALARLFPGLNHVPAIAAWTATFQELPDQQEFRRRAFGALREILSRISYRRPVALFIEDLQWGDADSTAALMELIRPPAAPSLMLLVTFDTDDRDRIPLLPLILRPSDQPCPVLEIELGPIPEPQAREAVLRALDTLGPEAEAQAAWAARESGGSPFFLAELVHFLRTERPDEAERAAFTLDRHIQAKIEALEPGPRRLVELLAVAGHPVSWEGLQQAARTPGLGDSLLHGLRVRRLMRVRSGAGPRRVEPYHDRVRRALVASLDPERLREDHRCLAEALESGNHADSAMLTPHFQAAGLLDRAAFHAERAGDAATTTFAFSQAVDFYRLALELLPSGDSARDRLWPRLASALALAGLGAEAGEAYLESARRSEGTLAQRHLRRAAEEFFRSGHTRRAMDILLPALSRYGNPIPQTQLGAIAGLVVSRLKLQMRGIAFEHRAEADIPPQDLDHLDTIWAVAMGLGPVDMLRAADFQARQLRIALDLGEPYRIIRGLAHESIFQAVQGNRNLSRTDALLDLTDREAQRHGHPEARARALMARGICATLLGHWRSAATHLEQAANLLREECRGVDYEVHVAYFQGMVAHSILGDLPRLIQQLPGRQQDALDRGDLLAASHYRVTCGHFPLLAADAPEAALQNLDEAMAACASRTFETVHYQEVVARTQILLYQGRLEGAWDFVTRRWGPMRDSKILSTQIVRITALELRARVRLGLASLRSGVSRSWLLHLVNRDIRRIQRELTPYGEALALKLQSGVAHLRGEADQALALLEQAAEAFQHSDMLLHEAACRLATTRQTESPLAGREVENLFHSRSVQDPWKWSLAHLPWLWEEPV